MRRAAVVTMLAVMVLVPLLWTAEAFARAGGGSSGGSRGSRSYSAPARSSPSQVSPSSPASRPSPMQPAPAPQRPGWGGMIGGLLMGGLIGSLLFGGLGHGLGGGGGMGLLEILLIAGLVYFGFRMLRSRQSQPASPAGYASPGSYGSLPESTSYAATTMEAPASESDLDRGIGYVRQMDSSFDPKRFSETASDIFFRIQAAWSARDMSRAGDVLTPEMQGALQKDCDRMRAEHRINRLENVAVREADVTEAWQERGQDFVTVHFLASLLDYTTDETGTQVLDGSTTQPVKFEEYWTFVRPVGPNPWRLTAIQQA